MASSTKLNGSKKRGEPPTNSEPTDTPVARPAPRRQVSSAKPPSPQPTSTPPADAAAVSKAAAPPPKRPTPPQQNSTQEQAAEISRIGLAQRLLLGMPSWVVSMLFHLILLLVMALFTIAPKVVEQTIGFSAVRSDTEVADDSLEMFDEAFNMEPLDEPQDLSTDQAAEVGVVGEISMADITGVAKVAATSINDMQVSTQAEEFASLLGSDGTATNEAPLPIANFFGAESPGQKFVFVVDNSNSMAEGRFETALLELIKTVDAMDAKQEFYVIFYSDTAYGLFHPATVNTYVPATKKNKQLLRLWLSTVQLCLRTRCEEAMRQAVALKPDVIYLLGDGVFTDKTLQLMTGELKGKVTVNTVGMELPPQERRPFTLIAEANRGTFTNVGVAPEAAELAAKRPVPRNNKRGPVWGLALPVKPK